jgi:pseudouridine synthase
LLLTNNGELAQELTHPSFGHNKTYLVKLDKPLTKEHQLDISQKGVRLDDGLSKFELERLNASGSAWQIRMSEGRNRQIRRTFRALGYHIRRLTRTQFSSYNLDNLASGEYCEIS